MKQEIWGNFTQDVTVYCRFLQHLTPIDREEAGAAPVVWNILLKIRQVPKLNKKPYLTFTPAMECASEAIGRSSMYNGGVGVGVRGCLQTTCVFGPCANLLHLASWIANVSNVIKASYLK